MWLEGIIEADKSLLLDLNSSSSLFWDGFFWYVTKAQTWIPLYLVLLYLLFKNNKWTRFLTVLVSIGIVILLADQLASGICKPYFARFRPTHDVEISQWVATVNGYRGGLYGFFSSHASNSFAIAVLMSLTVRNRIFSVLLIGWAALVSYSRIYLGVHFPGDVIVGATVGTLIALFVYFISARLQRKYMDDAQYISTQYTSSGYVVDDLYLVYLVLFSTFFYCIIRGMIFGITL